MGDEKVVTLKLESWDYTCGDGCCYEWGERLYVNDVQVADVEDCGIDAIKSTLEHLGYTVIIEDVDFDSTDLRIDWDDEEYDEEE